MKVSIYIFKSSTVGLWLCVQSRNRHSQGYTPLHLRGAQSGAPFPHPENNQMNLHGAVPDPQESEGQPRLGPGCSNKTLAENKIGDRLQNNMRCMTLML